MSNTKINTPAIVIRDGSLKATIWENEGDSGTFLTTTFAKTYSAEGGDPKDTQSFSRNDLLRVAELARRAHEKITYHSSEPNAE